MRAATEAEYSKATILSVVLKPATRLSKHFKEKMSVHSLSFMVKTDMKQHDCINRPFAKVTFKGT